MTLHRQIRLPTADELSRIHADLDHADALRGEECATGDAWWATTIIITLALVSSYLVVTM